MEGALAAEVNVLLPQRLKPVVYLGDICTAEAVLHPVKMLWSLIADYLLPPHHLGNGDELIPLRLAVLDNALGGLNGMTSIGPHAALVAVMHQDHISATNLPLCMGEDLLG